MKPAQLPLTRVGIDRGLFKTLSNSENSQKVDTLAETCGIAPELLGMHLLQFHSRCHSNFPNTGRILRYFASIDIVKETGLDEFAASATTKALASPEGEATAHMALVV